MLLSDLKARELRSIPTPPIKALAEFFHADAETKVHPLPVLWYFSSSLLGWNQCSCMYMMSILCLAVETVRSD